MTSGSGCFAKSQTLIQTDGHGDSMTDPDQRAESVKIRYELIFEAIVYS